MILKKRHFFPSILISMKEGTIFLPNQTKIYMMGDFKAFRYNNFTSSSIFKPSDNRINRITHPKE